MAKREIEADYCVRDLLKEASIKLDSQGSDVLEINNAFGMDKY